MTSPRRLPLLLLAMLSVGSLILASCSSGESTETSTEAADAGPKPVIVATTSILGDITSNVVGDLATVEVIVPANTDPHDFEPSAKQAALLRDADLIVANGLLLEEGLISIIESAEADGTPVVEVGELVDPLTFDEEFEAQVEAAEEQVEGAALSGSAADAMQAEAEGLEMEAAATDAGAGEEGHSDEKGHSDEEGHSHGEFDPHWWMDPTRAAQATGVISTTVADNTNVDLGQLAEQTEAYEAELLALDDELEILFSYIPEDRRLMVTNHDAFGYLATRYGFEVVGTVIPSGSDMAEPSAASLAGLATLINELGVPAIFTENISSPDLANTLAAETGTNVAVVPLFSDSIGEPGSDGENYIAMMRTNGERIANALK
jgi:zinc/manganese transport system substrate-binding protein